MSEKVMEIKLTREKGYLYFIDKEGDISRSKQGRPKGVKNRVNNETRTN